jgi:transcriptional regulator with XRE-family HTH domain
VTNWQYERTMTPEQYVIAFRLLGLDQAKAARVLGISERTSRRYVRGETEIPPAHALLLRAMLRYRVTPLVPDWQPEQN